mmetsp:Transcript_1171/g.4130  ORF Transcript_1171/g.4130 Transcript_1171/m.4130 type:complete len:629 (+) Transcript_1171:203-2089(+)
MEDSGLHSRLQSLQKQNDKLTAERTALLEEVSHAKFETQQHAEQAAVLKEELQEARRQLRQVKEAVTDGGLTGQLQGSLYLYEPCQPSPSTRAAATNWQRVESKMTWNSVDARFELWQRRARIHVPDLLGVKRVAGPSGKNTASSMERPERTESSSSLDARTQPSGLPGRSASTPTSDLPSHAEAATPSNTLLGANGVDRAVSDNVLNHTQSASRDSSGRSQPHLQRTGLGSSFGRRNSSGSGGVGQSPLQVSNVNVTQNAPSAHGKPGSKDHSASILHAATSSLASHPPPPPPFQHPSQLRPPFKPNSTPPSTNRSSAKQSVILPDRLAGFVRGEFIWKEGGSHGLLTNLAFECREEVFEDMERQVQLWNSQAYDKAVSEAEFMHRVELARQQKQQSDAVQRRLGGLEIPDGETDESAMPIASPVPPSPDYSGVGPKSKLHNSTLTELPAGKIPSIPHIVGKSSVFTDEQALLLTSALPPRLQVARWECLYSTQSSGISLQTLYRSCTKGKSPCVLVIKDMAGAVFGAFTNERWKVHQRYFGNGECFVFQLHPRKRKYAWTGDNNYLMFGQADSLAIGGGGHYAIFIDGELLYGHSGPCDTFGNGILSTETEFQVAGLEVWSILDQG